MKIIDVDGHAVGFIVVGNLINSGLAGLVDGRDHTRPPGKHCRLFFCLSSSGSLNLTSFRSPNVQ